MPREIAIVGRRHCIGVIREKITLSDRSRADAWRPTCLCGWAGIPHLKPGLAEREGGDHLTAHDGEDGTE